MYQRFWHKSTKTQKTSNCFLETLPFFHWMFTLSDIHQRYFLGNCISIENPVFFKTNINFNGRSSLHLALPHQSQEPRKPMASVILSSWPFRSFKAEVLSKDTRSEMDMALFPHPTSMTDFVESKKLDFFHFFPVRTAHESFAHQKRHGR